ncbi:MAG TPA: hypothetical protein PLV92_27125, partial [Pirellulaceae bacterium]|nr:hypothetical protein [Pirellulaceae bacterium]
MAVISIRSGSAMKREADAERRQAGHDHDHNHNHGDSPDHDHDHGHDHAQPGGSVKVAASPVDAPAAQAPSPYLNTRLDVAYVGSDACRKCHAGHDASFRHTGMGRSSAIVDLTREPPDGEFFHKASQRTYQVV